MRQVVFAVAAVAVVAAPPAKADPAKADLARLQGEWKVKSIEVAGMPVPGTTPGKLVIDGASFGGFGAGMTLKLDPTKTPKEVDVLLKADGRKWMGLYKLEGDTLTLCMALIEPGKLDQQKRPTDFDGKKVQMLITAERAKK